MELHHHAAARGGGILRDRLYPVPTTLPGGGAHGIVVVLCYTGNRQCAHQRGGNSWHLRIRGVGGGRKAIAQLRYRPGGETYETIDPSPALGSTARGPETNCGPVLGASRDLPENPVATIRGSADVPGTIQ